MGWLSKLFGAGLGETVEQVGNIATRFAEGHLGKKELRLELERLLAERDAQRISALKEELRTKERVMVAELEQGDNYTKRARPTIVYAGIIASIIDAIGTIDFSMPADFWYVWGGVCGVYMVGRTFEKRGDRGRFARIAAGASSSSILSDA